MRAYWSTVTILHLLATGHLGGEPVYRRLLEVGPFSASILSWGGPGLDEHYHMPSSSNRTPKCQTRLYQEPTLYGRDRSGALWEHICFYHMAHRFTRDQFGQRTEVRPRVECH